MENSHKKNPLLIELPNVIVTERCLLRPYREGDSVHVYPAIDESRNEVRPWIFWADTTDTVEKSEEFVRRSMSQWASRENLNIGAWTKDGSRYLGGSGFHRINWDVPSLEIGYWIRTSETGNGYVTEWVRALTHHAFHHFECNRLLIRCDVGNTKSRAIPERLGFQLESIQRNEIRNHHNNLCDVAWYTLFPDTYRALDWAT